MQPLKDAILCKLILTLTKHELNDLEMNVTRSLWRVCRLMIPKPTHNANTPTPLECTATLTGLILDGESQLPRGMDLDEEAKTAIKNRHRTILKTKANDL